MEGHAAAGQAGTGIGMHGSRVRLSVLRVVCCPNDILEAFRLAGFGLSALSSFKGQAWQAGLRANRLAVMLSVLTRNLELENGENVYGTPRKNKNKHQDKARGVGMAKGQAMRTWMGRAKDEGW